MNFDLSDVEIRDERPGDALGIYTVFYKAWLTTYPNEEIGLTVEDIEERYKEFFTEESIAKANERLANIPKNQKRIVALYKGEIVGTATVSIQDKYNQLKTIYVLPEFQGKGIGKMLYKEVVQFCDKSKRLMLEVATYNNDTIRFYEKLGFKDTGRRFTDEVFKFKSGAVIPEMEMEIKPGFF